MQLLKFLTLLSAIFLASLSLEAHSASDSALRDWFTLQRGNAKFIRDPKYIKQRIGLINGQNPRYAILSCSDSRVPPEIVFDQGLGELFVARVAGNVTDAVVVDSIEFAVDTWDVTTLVVLGHEGCGAVEGALERLRRNCGKIDRIIGDHYLAVLVPIEKAIVKARIDIYAPDALEQAIRANVAFQAQELLRRSPSIRKSVAGGKIVLVGAEYFLAKGNVEQLFIVDRYNYDTALDEFWLESAASSSSNSSTSGC